MRLILLFLVLIGNTLGNLLIPGIVTQNIELKSSAYQLVGFPQAALNQTEVQITIDCQENADLDFTVQFVLRSSPCDKEFFNTKMKQLLFYFSDGDHIPDSYSYSKIMFYKSEEQKFKCKDSHGPIILSQKDNIPMVVKNVTPVAVQLNRFKREVFPGVNGKTVDGGAKTSLSSWHPAQTIPLDGIYFLVMKITGANIPQDKQFNISITVEWRAPYGFLSAIDYPLLRFYIIMCVFYAILALVWLVMCIKYYRDILRIQYWIGAVIVLGMIEKAFFLSEYTTMNNTGQSNEGILELAELISCLKRTMSRVLVIIVSVGYGVVKPRLGNTLSQVAGVGLVYFVFCSIEGLARVSKNHVEAAKQKQFANLPLVITELVIFYWIFSALVSTMRTLRMRKNEMKLSVYRHFINTLLFAVIASVIFMVWSMMYHIFPTCLMDWKELWVDIAFWHVLFCFILVVIMILWRPSNNNQRYAFTPLLDDSEDENDQDEIFNSSVPGYEVLKQRDSGAAADTRKQREKDKEDQKLQDDLRWIEDHIPTSITDHLIMDEDEDKEARELELSKML